MDDFDPDAYLADASSQDTDAAQPAFDPDQYISKFDPDAYLANQQDAEGPVATAARFGANAAIPGAIGAAVGGAAGGAAMGALEGSVAGPVGTAIGFGTGLLAGGVTAYMASKAQTAAKQGLGIDDSTQMALDAEANPKSAFAGELAGNLLTMRPDRAASTVTRALAGGVGAGIEGAQEYATEGSIDPAKVLASGAAFAAFPSPNRVGQRLEATVSRLGSKVAGRPNVEPNPAAAPAQDEAQSSQQRVDVGEASFVQPPPSIDGDTVGNPQSQPTRSDRIYQKDQTAEAAGPDMLTQGEYTPDVAAALNAFRNAGNADIGNPKVDVDASLREAPVQTGFPNPNANKPTLALKRQPSAPEPTSAPAAQATTEEVAPRAPTPETEAINPKTLTEQAAALGEWGGPNKEAAAKAAEALDNMNSANAGLKDAIAKATAPKAEPEASGGPAPIHDQIVAEREKVAQPTAAQAEADNYKQGHPGRMFGRMLTMETPKGGVREDNKNTPPKWRVENYPTDYFKVLGTKGADNDHLDLHYVGTGDRHFVIDQKDPATGKFDEHKVMAYAKDPLDALDHYYRGFNDGSGESRVLSIKEATKDELTTWLAKPGKKKTPFDESVSAEGASTGPTEGEKPLPKVVTLAVTELRGRAVDGQVTFAGRTMPVEDAVTALQNMEPSARIAAASQYVNKTKTVPARPDRVRTKPPAVEGLATKGARDKADAEGMARNIATTQKAYEDAAPNDELKVPTTPEEKASELQRLRDFMEATKKADFIRKGSKKVYEPATQHPAYEFKKAVKKLLQAKNPSDKSWSNFIAAESQIRSGDTEGARALRQAESDIALNPRRGDEAIAGAEAKAAGTNNVEDELNAAIDAKRRQELGGEGLKEAARDAGLTPSEAEQLDPTSQKAHQVREGYAFVPGEGWTKVTQKHLGDLAASAEAMKPRYEADKARIDEAFSGENQFPGVSHILGSDWGGSWRGGGEPGAYKQAAYGALRSKYDFPERQLRRLQRVYDRANSFDIPHEEAEAMVKPEPATPDSIAQERGATKALDVSNPHDRAQLAEALSKGGHVGSANGPAALAEGSTPEAPKASEVRKIDIGGLDKDYIKNLLERANKPKNTSRLDSDEVVKMAKQAPAKSTLRGLGEALLRDEGGWVDLNKIASDIKRLKNSVAGKLGGVFKHEPRSSYIAREAKSPQEQYARSLSTDLFKIRQGDIQHKIGLMQWTNELPKELNNPKTLERMYFAREAGKTNLLDPQEQALYNRYLKPVFDENDKLFDNISSIEPWRLGPKVGGDHIYRIAKGNTDEHNILKHGESSDPIEGTQAMASRAVNTMLPRRFFSMEDPKGNRFLISANDDGFTVWHNRKPIKVTDPSFSYEPNKQYTVGGKTFTMKEAMTPEIEQHAMFDRGERAQYYHNAALSAAAANYYLGSIGRHLQFLHNLKEDPEFLKYATAPGREAPSGYRPTKLANFKDWKMDPQLAYTLDDFAQPGINEDALNTLRKVSQAITKAIFWLPTAHMRNVAEHWFVGRGFRWLPFSGGYKSLAEDGLSAIKSVVAQDDIQKALRDRGAGTIYGGVVTQGFMDNLAKGLGEAVEKNPAKWDPIARQFGIGPSDLVRAIYRASSKTMWAANDMFLTHSVMENMRQGMSMDEAITHAERHIPNYRIPATVMGSGRGARIFAQIMSEPALTVFGRYHYGVFNSYANIAKDLVKGNGAAKLDAVGNLFAMGLLAFAIYPVLDKAAQSVTGNDHATIARRGPISIPSHLAASAQGKEDIASAGRSTLTISPLLATAMEQLSNKDYRGKDIVERGDVQRAARGDVRAAGRAAMQEGEFLARGLVSPYNTLANTLTKQQGVGSGLRDQALDIKNPSARAIRYEGQSSYHNQKAAIRRQRYGAGPAESIYNRFTKP